MQGLNHIPKWLFSRINKRKNYYRILGVSKVATKNQIKLAYIKLAKKHHPDMNKGQESQTFKDINEANGILSDDCLKKQYDALFERQQYQHQETKHPYSHQYPKKYNQQNEGYKTYEYPKDFSQWWKGQRKQRPRSPKSTSSQKVHDKNTSSFSSQTNYDKILKMHYDMSQMYSTKQKQQFAKNQPTLNQEILKVKSKIGNKIKEFKQGLWTKSKGKQQ